MNSLNHEPVSSSTRELVRVRFAPSPTGYLHIGGARTALFNWLFAKKNGGTFILRIEDTDEARSTAESVDAILDSMTWLGLNWDEGPGLMSDFDETQKEVALSDGISENERGEYGPYFQMKRKEKGIYQKYIDKLLKENKAYKCYCTADEIEQMREKAKAEGKQPKYNGKCRDLSDSDRTNLESEGRTSVIRLKTPQEGKIKVNDIIRGEVEFDNSQLDDLVLMKASGMPAYNFACVIDDHLMDITHVIRGDDHLSNTPKQLHIYNALGWEIPVFAHLSMILGEDGSRLSKRHGHTSVLEYKTDGYLPGALINYLGLLGWSTEDSQQLFEINDMAEKFSLERCSKSPAVFDPQKLNWMNGEYVRALGGEELYKVFMRWIEETGRKEEINSWDKGLLKKLIVLEYEKIKLFNDVFGLFDFFFTDNVEYKPEAVDKVLKKDTAKSVLEESLTELNGISDFSAENLEKWAREYSVKLGVGAGKVFHPLRVAVSGRTHGPSLFHMLEFLGKDKVKSRIQNCLNSCF